MPRIRSLKPGFFTNEELAELSPWHRLCFEGLWVLADREGRLEDRPRRIKAAIFPYDVVDVDEILSGLAEKGFIVRYAADGVAYLQVTTFLKHQRPKSDEAVSVIPAPVSTIPRGNSTGPRTYKGQGTERSGQRTEGSAVATACPPADGAVSVGIATTTADGVDLVALWNTRTHPPIPRCRDLTTKRRRHIKARLTERQNWAEIFDRIQASAFCRGEKNDWIASFDWVIGSPDVAVKVLEGRYDDRMTRAPAVREYDPWLCPHEPRCPHRAACAIVSARSEKKPELV